MTPGKFNNLHEETKKQYLFDNGTTLAVFSNSLFLIKLFAIDDFLAEVYFSRIDAKMQNIYAIEYDDDQLLNRIDIQELLSSKELSKIIHTEGVQRYHYTEDELEQIDISELLSALYNKGNGQDAHT